jgi:hypothetical protein
VHRHEITGERRRRLLAQEAAPGELVSLRRGRQAVAEEDRPHRGRRNRDAEALQFADDSSVAPTRVLACERNNKRLQATIEPRPPGPPVRILQRRLTSSRCQRNSVAARTDRVVQALRGSARASAARTARSTAPSRGRRGWVPAQNRQLVPEQQDLEFLGALRSAQQHGQLNQTAERQIDERPDQAHLPI